MDICGKGGDIFLVVERGRVIGYVEGGDGQFGDWGGVIYVWVCMVDGEVEFFLEGKVGDKEGGEVVGVELEGGGVVGGCLVGIVMLV